MANKICEDCKFWERIPEDSMASKRGKIVGRCRRYAPQVGGGEHILWPITKQDDWCGELSTGTAKKKSPKSKES